MQRAISAGSLFSSNTARAREKSSVASEKFCKERFAFALSEIHRADSTASLFSLNMASAREKVTIASGKSWRLQ